MCYVHDILIVYYKRLFKESLLLVYASDEGAYQSAQLHSLMSLVLPTFKNGNPGDEVSCKGAQQLSHLLNKTGTCI